MEEGEKRCDRRRNALFEALPIQREACSGGKHIPLIVENVRGAQKWVGRARWNFGSFYLWGDVPALMPMTSAIKTRRIVIQSFAGCYKPVRMRATMTTSGANRGNPIRLPAAA